jgi:uncharacterized membrane-anchored protein YjiN (DUF445 family)
MIGHAIRILTASGEADILFERAIGIATRWIKKNRRKIDALVSERSRWWIPKAIDRRIAGALVSGTLELLGGLRKPNSEARTKFRKALAGIVDELLNSPEQRERINAGMRRLLADSESQAWLRTAWNELCQTGLDDLAQSSSRLRLALEKPISIVAQALATNGLSCSRRLRLARAGAGCARSRSRVSAARRSLHQGRH